MSTQGNEKVSMSNKYGKHFLKPDEYLLYMWEDFIVTL